MGEFGLMETEVIRIRQSAALYLPEIQELLLDTFKSNHLVKDPMAAITELIERIHLPDLGLFVGKVGDKWAGMMFCQLSRTAFNPGCVVLHLYCKGGNQLRNELVEAMFNFAREGGFSDIIAIDTNNKPRGFEKLFALAGKPTQLGTVFHFDMKESLL